MFNFRSKEQLLPSSLSALAIAILVGTFLYMIVVPPPSAAGLAKTRQRSRTQLQNEITKAKAQTKDAVTQAGNRIWVGNADSVMAQVLAQLTTRADRYKLKVAAFRPQRSNVIGGLTELPCNIQITGPYNTLVSFLGSLDAPDTRIALRSVQVSASDGNSNNVTALMGLSIYFTETAPSVATTDKGDANG